MKIEIENYITNNYYELLKITKRITKYNDWSQDLLHEVISQLYDKKEIKIKSLDDDSIKFYIIRIITINWHSKTSPFFYKLRRESTKYSDLVELTDMAISNNCFDEHKMLDIVENEWAEMNWFNKIIFEKYLTLGSLKKVSMDTTIPLRSIHRYVNDTKRIIKENAFKKYNNE